MNKNAKNWLIALAVVVIVGVVGNMDFQDEVREQLSYCENVKAGVWPDYDGTYKTECTAEKLEEFKKILR